MKAFVSALVFITATAVAPLAVGLDGNQLLKSCEAYFKTGDLTEIDHGRAMYCLGIVTGVGEVMAMQQETGAIARICPPSVVKAEQYARVALKYLKDNPASLDEDGYLIVTVALGNAYPCE